MKNTNVMRRQLLIAGAAAPVLGMLPRTSWAAALESLYMFIPAAPGGGWDSTGRAIEQALRTAKLVNTVQFENVGGAGGMVGLPKFVNQQKGKPNAVMVGGSVMVGAGIANKSPVTIKDVVPLVRLTEEASVIAVPTNSPYKTWQDLAAALKANPKAVSVAGGSAGGTDHLLLGMILRSLGANAKSAAYVAYAGGGAAVASIIGGQVAAGISGYSEFAEQIKGGRMRALAVSGNKRIPGVDVPTLKELGTNVTAANWRGLFGAPGISNAQRDALIDLFTKMHTSPAWVELIGERKWVDVFLAGDAFAKDLATDLAETETVMKELGLA
ncbi:MAG: tripartite tricarboxylate transporter substrate-binding protein [Rhodocyclaceae bacterium]